MRQKLRAGLEKLKPESDWSFITTQIGMFAYTGLTAEQVPPSPWSVRLCSPAAVLPLACRVSPLASIVRSPAAGLSLGFGQASVDTEPQTFGLRLAAGGAAGVRLQHFHAEVRADLDGWCVLGDGWIPGRVDCQGAVRAGAWGWPRAKLHPLDLLLQIQAPFAHLSRAAAWARRCAPRRCPRRRPSAAAPPAPRAPSRRAARR